MGNKKEYPNLLDPDPNPRLLSLLESRPGTFSNRESLGEFCYGIFRSRSKDLMDEDWPEWRHTGDEMRLIFRDIGDALYDKLKSGVC